MIIVRGKLLEPVEKVETLEILGIRDFRLQTDSPIDTLSLRWEDIDWEMNRMSIPEPKVEHHQGRGIRSCPIFPELRPILDEAFEIFGDKSEFVVGVFLKILHSQFSILNSRVTEDDFAKAAGVAKVMV